MTVCRASIVSLAFPFPLEPIHTHYTTKISMFSCLNEQQYNIENHGPHPDSCMTSKIIQNVLLPARDEKRQQ